MCTTLIISFCKVAQLSHQAVDHKQAAGNEMAGALPIRAKAAEITKLVSLYKQAAEK